MKKLVATVSVLIALTCAYGLASTDEAQTELNHMDAMEARAGEIINESAQAQSADPQSENPAQGTQLGAHSEVNPMDLNQERQPEQQAGRADAPNTASPSLREDRWSTASQCTDMNGLSYRRGTRGFERCVEAKRQESGS